MLILAGKYNDPWFKGKRVDVDASTLRKTIYIYICDIDIENIDSSHHTIHLVCVYILYTRYILLYFCV